MIDHIYLPVTDLKRSETRYPTGLGTFCSHRL
jgi:hypothetical protein